MTTAPPVPTPEQIAVLHLRMVLEALAETAADADKAAAGLPREGLPLADLAGLIADTDEIAGLVADVREQLEARARGADGWDRGEAVFPDRGLRAERKSSPRKRWDAPGMATRLAPLLCVDTATGEMDADADQVKRIIGRFLDFAAIDYYRAKRLQGAGVDYGDYVTVEPGRTRVVVHRETPAGGA